MKKIELYILNFWIDNQYLDANSFAYIIDQEYSGDVPSQPKYNYGNEQDSFTSDVISN